MRPALIIEITSPETAALDRSAKLEEYELAGVPLYVIVDTVTRRREPVLRLLGYQPLAGDARGRLWLEPARLWLGGEANEIVCYDEAARPLGECRALAAALTAERQARVEAEGRAAAAEARMHALEAELRRLRGEAP